MCVKSVAINVKEATHSNMKTVNINDIKYKYVHPYHSYSLALDSIPLPFHLFHFPLPAAIHFLLFFHSFLYVYNNMKLFLNSLCEKVFETERMFCRLLRACHFLFYFHFISLLTLPFFAYFRCRIKSWTRTM